ncbi:7416_t:CDS:2 [Funneliformis caledonium]|uniref:7416_t:CDS:1 n=1 Tax=Funneliformis caledonium TaxID=1117310 RepID=A0A9N9DQB9_9GLOM|nr:7416_t:CDS:2 [Funneliformis caledonium]
MKTTSTNLVIDTKDKDVYSPETSREILVNKDYNDKPGSNSSLNDDSESSFCKEKKVAKAACKLNNNNESIKESESNSPLHNDLSSSCKGIKIIKSACKLNSDEETPFVSPAK